MTLASECCVTQTAFEPESGICARDDGSPASQVDLIWRNDGGCHKELTIEEVEDARLRFWRDFAADHGFGNICQTLARAAVRRVCVRRQGIGEGLSAVAAQKHLSLKGAVQSVS
jgi:hypothetical protein